MNCGWCWRVTRFNPVTQDFLCWSTPLSKYNPWMLLWYTRASLLYLITLIIHCLGNQRLTHSQPTKKWHRTNTTSNEVLQITERMVLQTLPKPSHRPMRTSRRSQRSNDWNESPRYACSSSHQGLWPRPVLSRWRLSRTVIPRSSRCSESRLNRCDVYYEEKEPTYTVRQGHTSDK